MSTQKPFLYQPEDLERLLRTKTFNGLLPEERAFVLQHVSNEEEFNELKMLLGKIESSDHEMQDPPAAVWKNLKKEFNAQKPSRFKVWLNFLFPPLPKWTGFRTVSFSLVGMAAIIGAIVWFVPSENNSNQYASANLESKDSSDSSLDTVSENSEFKINPEKYAELQTVSEIYISPEVREIDWEQEYPRDEIIELREEAVPANDMIEEKSNKTRDVNSTDLKVASDDIPSEFTNSAPTNTFILLNNSATLQLTSDSTIPTITIATDSLKIQPQKKKKTTPNKK